MLGFQTIKIFLLLLLWGVDYTSHSTWTASDCIHTSALTQAMNEPEKLTKDLKKVMGWPLPYHKTGWDWSWRNLRLCGLENPHIQYVHHKSKVWGSGALVSCKLMTSFFFVVLDTLILRSSNASQRAGWFLLCTLFATLCPTRAVSLENFMTTTKGLWEVQSFVNKVNKNRERTQLWGEPVLKITLHEYRLFICTIF